MPLGHFDGQFTGGPCRDVDRGVPDALTAEQIQRVASDIEGASENESMAFGSPDPRSTFEAEMEKERRGEKQAADNRETSLRSYIARQHGVPITGVSIEHGHVKVRDF